MDGLSLTLRCSCLGLRSKNDNYNLYLGHGATASPHNDLVIIISDQGFFFFVFFVIFFGPRIEKKVSWVFVEEENRVFINVRYHLILVNILLLAVVSIVNNHE